MLIIYWKTTRAATKQAATEENVEENQSILSSIIEIICWDSLRFSVNYLAHQLITASLIILEFIIKLPRRSFKSMQKVADYIDELAMDNTSTGLEVEQTVSSTQEEDKSNPQPLPSLQIGCVKFFEKNTHSPCRERPHPPGYERCVAKPSATSWFISSSLSGECNSSDEESDSEASMSF